MLSRFENLAENEKEKLLTEHDNLLVSPCFELVVWLRVSERNYYIRSELVMLVGGYQRENIPSISFCRVYF
jgi:hypothetical protein